MNDILLAVGMLSGLGVLFGLLLAWASKKFHVDVDPRVARIMELLPGANCGACGAAGCGSFAEGLVEKKYSLNSCVACAAEQRLRLAEVLGASTDDLSQSIAQIAVVGCGGGTRCLDSFAYRGLPDCRVAAQALGGHKQCRYGCLGQGTCQKACPFGAITMGDDNLPHVSPSACRGCKKCVAVCPRGIMYMVERKKKVYIACRSRDKGPLVMKKCTAGCIACGRCVKICPVQAITLENNLATINYATCISCKKCVSACPTKAIAEL